MNYKEALNILDSKSIDSLESITSKYRDLVKVTHPDQGGTTEEFITVRNAFKTILKFHKVKRVVKDKEGTQKEVNDNIPENIQNKLEEVVPHLDATLNILLMGQWLWITGITYPHKDKLKEFGFKFSNNKKSWYWHESAYKKRSGKTLSFNRIADLYGKEEIGTGKQKVLPGGLNS